MANLAVMLAMEVMTVYTLVVVDDLRAGCKPVVVVNLPVQQHTCVVVTAELLPQTEILVVAV